MSDWDPEAFTRGLIAPTDPAWIRNIAADPNVTVQAEGWTFDARATIAEGADREQLWDRHVEARPEFADSPGEGRSGHPDGTPDARVLRNGQPSRPPPASVVDRSAGLFVCY